MSSRVTVNRRVSLPNRIVIERYRRAPDLGPRILFFSGGTALRDLSRKIIEYTHNTIHLITPFDSGGSSAKIRDAFTMIAVGDLRNRLMALADQNISGNPDIYRLFAYRLEGTDNNGNIRRLYEMIQGIDPLVAIVPEPMRQIISTYLRSFVNKMPLDFDLNGANIGNLILTGGYLKHSRDIDIILYIFSRLVEARGTVRPTVTGFCHIVAELADGTKLVGQHLVTGKDHPPIESPVENFYLTESITNPQPTTVRVGDDIVRMIRDADGICYPMGSFYTSLIANLLPGGVGEGIRKNGSVKVYVPNSVADPEQTGMSLADSVRRIIETLARDCEKSTPSDFITFVLIDPEHERYPFAVNVGEIEAMGIGVIQSRIISGESEPYVDPRLLIDLLLSLT